eukprot:CAMPEP_0113678834 /NCGR_PEP_ID=MMETSP0038_2-20120614/10211_1 /TAXON_ID=2898 /ORGANISM="Cryptomonas paramecium" /LENGTH=241 /DNA_ID=CAMNT_0000596603 /DNA_START=75 /DNA_END=800 /DNA_ORIENTATION=+ /assembly_acc=CAM_ASM_000170
MDNGVAMEDLLFDSPKSSGKEGIQELLGQLHVLLEVDDKIQGSENRGRHRPEENKLEQFNDLNDKLREFFVRMKSSDPDELHTLVIVGHNGEGKSLLANVLVSISQNLSHEYGFRPTMQRNSQRITRQSVVCPADEQDEFLRENLEAFRHISCAPDSPEASDVDFVKAVKLHVCDAELVADDATEEAGNLKAVDECCLIAPEGDKVGFILPSCGHRASTTQFPIRLCTVTCGPGPNRQLVR